MRNILQYILKILAKMILWRYKPEVVAVTGSVGKSGVKEAIYSVLKKKFRVRRNIKNYNNEIGVPLTVLGQDISPPTNILGLFGWLVIFIKAAFTFIWSPNYPQILVLEMGISKPGDMKYLMDFVPIKIGIFTAVGEFPVHLEFFPEKGKLIQEKAILLKSVPQDGLAVMNYDDLSVRTVGDDLPKRIRPFYYGFGDGAELKFSNFQLMLEDLDRGDFGVNFKFEYQGKVVPVRIDKALGKQQVYAAGAAAGVGLYFGLNLVEISNALRKFQSLVGRTKLIKGIKNTWIIDDSYNASPLATVAALEILEQFPGRKIAVLGDMLELGEETEIAHRQIGRGAAQRVDLLFTVGERTVFLADEARKQGLAQDKIFKFSRSDEAGIPLQERLEQGDVILIKGSRSMQMDRIVREIMAEPEKADKLLVE